MASTNPMTPTSSQKAHFSPAIRFLRMSGQVSTEIINEQELYRIVKQLSAAMVLGLRLVISASEKPATCRIGESFPSTIKK